MKNYIALIGILLITILVIYIDIKFKPYWSDKNFVQDKSPFDYGIEEFNKKYKEFYNNKNGIE